MCLSFYLFKWNLHYSPWLYWKKISQTHAIFHLTHINCCKYFIEWQCSVLWEQIQLFTEKKKEEGKKRCKDASTPSWIWSQDIKIHEVLSTELMQTLFAQNTWWHCKPAKMKMVCESFFWCYFIPLNIN